jgi:hypothetical protein
LATLEALPDNPAEAGFFPLPEGYSLEPEPFTDAQLAELKGLFGLSSLYATPPGQAVSDPGSGSRSQAA